MSDGFALRFNGSCDNPLDDWGPTARPFHLCCPPGSSNEDQYNRVCCPNRGNCTDALMANPHCADRTWDLYNNDGFFCCVQGTFGYSVEEGNSDGCADEGYTLKTGEQRLQLIKSGDPITTATSSTASTSSTSTSSSATSSPATSNVPGHSHKPSGGVIAGAVVGAVAGLALIVLAILLLIRSYRKTSAHSGSPAPSPYAADSSPFTQYPFAAHKPTPELDGAEPPGELEGGHSRHELDGNGVARKPGAGYADASELPS